MNKSENVTNCPCCGEHSLHILGDEVQTQQCLHCGYSTTNNYKLDKVGNVIEKEWAEKLTDDMKNWAKKENGMLWIPSVMALPIGMLYPDRSEEDTDLLWKFAPMVKVDEKEKELYKNPMGGYYEKRYDVENAQVYKDFFPAMLELNKRIKDEMEQNKVKDNLTPIPKLKNKVDNESTSNG